MDEQMSREDLARTIRGKHYHARAQLRRLQGAWPDARRRNAHQRRAIRQATEILRIIERRAAEEGVEL